MTTKLAEILAKLEQLDVNAALVWLFNHVKVIKSDIDALGVEFTFCTDEPCTLYIADEHCSGCGSTGTLIVFCYYIDDKWNKIKLVGLSCRN